MDTTITAITSQTAYTKVADDGLYGAVQNIMGGVLWVNIADSAPTNTDLGFVLRPLDTITPDWGAGNVYVRLYKAGATSKVAVSE